MVVSLKVRKTTAALYLTDGRRFERFSRNWHEAREDSWEFDDIVLDKYDDSRVYMYIYNTRIIYIDV